jgi:hypothetical protein
MRVMCLGNLVKLLVHSYSQLVHLSHRGSHPMVHMQYGGTVRQFEQEDTTHTSKVHIHFHMVY